ncbi:helix-turn-helix domain containing protein [Actinoplanes sp. Pm04-4]|uniref:Helix-turn-helix domain containing protein n=1 Tax=Paractinoplanes pyxinae TaxID=2997416 RepID=A0ABT4BFU0_9ACTN|nr:TetR/AcrR family transcriptional regulator [Actinoplanes pyxinae]MCY1145417.1 helix-turn-helix domain containing protein [Actinoplanes pyxinae]
MGLREQKKERTRRHIADTAWELIADNGFARVTVAEIARAAQVAEATVFNYFATKEDLFFFRLDEYGESLVRGVAGRPPGEAAPAAFHRLLLAEGGLVGQLDSGDSQALDRLRTVNRVVAESPALQAREQVSFTRTAELLAATLGGDTLQEQVAARVVAHGLIAVQRALVLQVREAVLADEIPPGFASQLAESAAHAFALLENGLAGYGTRDS